MNTAIGDIASLKNWLSAQIKEISKKIPEVEIAAQTRSWEAFTPRGTTYYASQVRVLIVGNEDKSGEIRRALKKLGDEFVELDKSSFRFVTLHGPDIPLNQTGDSRVGHHGYILVLETGDHYPKPGDKPDDKTPPSNTANALLLDSDGTGIAWEKVV